MRLRAVFVALLCGLLAFAPAGSAQTARKLLMVGGGTPAWVPNPSNPPDIAVNWTLNQAWKKSGGLTTPAALGITTSRASVKQVVDSNGNWSQVAANVTARSNLGRSTEEARTNSIRNNLMVGAVAGSPGTLPTNWAFDAGVMTRSIVGTGTINGINYIDVRWQAAANSDGNYNNYFEVGNNIAGLQNQVWSNSIFLAVVAGSVSNMTIIAPEIRENNSSGTSLSVDIGTDIRASLTSVLQRFSLTQTLGQATTAFIQPGVRMGFGISQTIDVTLRIGWPQLELGASVTSPIVTSGSAATRNADMTSMPVTVGSAYTLFEQATPQAPVNYATTQVTLSIDDGTTGNRAYVIRNLSAGTVTAAMISGSVQGYAGTSAAAWAQNAQGNIAASFISGAQAAYFNSVTLTTSTGPGSTLPISPTTLHFGARADGVQQLNGLATIDAVWLTQAIPNAQLQSMQ